MLLVETKLSIDKIRILNNELIRCPVYISTNWTVWMFNITFLLKRAFLKGKKISQQSGKSAGDRRFIDHVVIRVKARWAKNVKQPERYYTARVRSFFGWPSWMVNLESGSRWMLTITETLKPCFTQRLNNQVSYTPASSLPLPRAKCTPYSRMLSLCSSPRRACRSVSFRARCERLFDHRNLSSKMRIMRLEGSPKEMRGSLDGNV